MKRLGLLAIFLSASIQTALAGDFLGQYCVDLSTSTGSHRAFQLDVSSAGPSSYQLNGLYINQQDGVASPIVGSASFIDSGIKMIISETHIGQSSLIVSTYNINLSSTDLSGVYRASTMNTIGISYVNGMAQLTSCVEPLTVFPAQDPDPIDCSFVDNDGDGYTMCRSTPFGLIPFDCDDNNHRIYPGAAEISGDGIDQDCNGQDLVDADGDGYASVSLGGEDCNDNNPYMHPGATEVCGDGIDEDCNGSDKFCSAGYPNFVSKVSFGLMDEANPPLTYHDRIGIKFTLGQQNYELKGNFNSAKTYASLVSAIKEELARVGLSAAVKVYLGDSFFTYNDYNDIVYGTRIVMEAKNQKFSNFAFIRDQNATGYFDVFGIVNIY